MRHLVIPSIWQIRQRKSLRTDSVDHGVKDNSDYLTAAFVHSYTSPDAIRYAVKLGVALQMTNILRDVGEDWRRGYSNAENPVK